MKYIDINDVEKISDNIKSLNEKLLSFSHPEDLVSLSKIIKKNIPFYRRRDFYAYMTYLNLLSMPENVKVSNVKQSNDNKKSDKVYENKNNSSQPTMWMNYSVRGTSAISEFKSYIATKAKINESDIVRIIPNKYYSFVIFSNEKALDTVISALQGVNYKGKVLKVNKKSNASS